MSTRTSQRRSRDFIYFFLMLAHTSEAVISDEPLIKKIQKLLITGGEWQSSGSETANTSGKWGRYIFGESTSGHGKNIYSGWSAKHDIRSLSLHKLLKHLHHLRNRSAPAFNAVRRIGRSFGSRVIASTCTTLFAVGTTSNDCSALYRRTFGVTRQGSDRETEETFQLGAFSTHAEKNVYCLLKKVRPISTP